MTEPDIGRFEAQAAETVGAMKELFAEFEKRLGEVVATQRLASSEARNEGAKTRAALEELARQARAIAEAQRQALTELRGEWRLHVAENSKAAGAEMAISFGEEIAAGLERKLLSMTEKVERATRQFEWVTALKWGGALAIASALMVIIGVWALLPSAPGLSGAQVREAMAHLSLCRIGQGAHICVAIDDKLRAGKAPNGADLAVISQM